MSLSYNQITAISPFEHGLIVKGKHSGQTVVVWRYLENYDSLKVYLESIHPITPLVYSNVFQKYPKLLAGLMVICLGAFYASTNKIVVGLSGSLTSGILIWSFYKIVTAQQVDKRIKSVAWLSLLVLVSVIFGMIYKLTA